MANKREHLSLVLCTRSSSSSTIKMFGSAFIPKKKEMVETIMASDDVQFYWIIITAHFEIDEEVQKLLLHMIVELFLTTRGFSYVSMWLEQYKQAFKKPTQRSKSLRRDIYNSSSSNN